MARTRALDRTRALERYRQLPLPDTSMEAWRFTDLSGFDPDAFAQNGHVQVPGTVPGTGTGPEGAMLEIDVAGVGTIGEGGVAVRRAPDRRGLAAPSPEEEAFGALFGAG